MSDFEFHPRASGPSVVAGGPEDAPAILVLDPAGIAKHDVVPPTWQPLMERRRVVWCRLPAQHQLAESEQALAELAHNRAVVDVVSSGPAAELAMELAITCPDAVRSVLLVDPAATDQPFPAQEAELADRLWKERSEARVREVENVGVLVRVIAHSAGGLRDRVPPPVPFGHPDLVEVLGTAIDELDASSVEHADPRP